MDKSMIPNGLFGRTKEEIVQLCLNCEFPGTVKWPANHPIWNCYIFGHLSPKDAWSSEYHIRKAVDNLFYITYTSLFNNKYPEFVSKVENAFFLLDENTIPLLREILHRFTVVKIAPKVTALMPSTLFKIIKDSGIDISAGVYCPMAGFGGIVEGAKRWFKDNNLNYEDKIEAYDINPELCKWYGWKQQDVLSDIRHTNKIVIACPPFGEKTERWPGTPKEMYYDFHDWCCIIKKQIIAPNYIFIGPEINSKPSTNKLFQKKVGVKFYPQYSLNFQL